jgi:hypothetical protein
MIAQKRHHHENAPEPENDARNGGEHLYQGRDRLPNPKRRQLSEINRRRDAQRHRND